MTKNNTKTTENEELQDFDLSIKRNIIDIINDCPSLVRLGDKDFMVKDMRYYSLYRISRLALKMKEADGDSGIDNDNKIVTALCTDLDAMCEIMAIILCNHRFTADGEEAEGDELMTRNDKMVRVMKAKVMNSTFDVNQWSAIVLGAIKSIDLGGFFLLRKSVNMLTDSLLMRKKKSAETASQFMEALSLRTQQTS